MRLAVFALVLSLCAIVVSLSISLLESPAAKNWAQPKYQFVSEVVNPQLQTHAGTIFKTVDADTGATIYVLLVGNDARGIAVFGEPPK